jgi:hypothetical protein
LLVLAAVTATAGGGVGEAMAVEHAAYTVEERDGDFEVRRYAARVVAETFVEGDFEKVGSEGFRRLAAYIGGRNRSKASISMTAPVTQESDSERISMTAPVTQESTGSRFRITFVMPAQYTLETLPQPLDERVVLREEAAHRIAAVRYGGTWSRSRYQAQLERLRAWLDSRGLAAEGEPVWARYNPPFVPWFLRRNEILLRLAASQ